MRAKSLIIGLVCLFVVLVVYGFAQQELSDSTKTKINQEAINAQKAPKDILPPDSQSTSEEGKTSSHPKGGWSEKLTGKEIQKVQIEVKTEEELKFLQDMGLKCCTGLGTCACQITLEQFDQIKAQRIAIKRVQEEESHEQDERWQWISSGVDRVTLGPNQVIMASMQVNTKEDLEFLRKIGVNCCVDTGICKCQINKEQWKQIDFHGFRHGINVIDTLEWGKETKPKSERVIPPKPKPTKVSEQSKEIFLLKVEIKTGNEMEVIRQVMRRVGGQCESNGKEILLRFTKEQMEALKEAGIEFEVQK